MKEETKNRIKKIAKIGGFAITFGFAVFGVLCAAMLMANGSGKKDDIKTLDSSLVLNGVRSERNIKPRKAPDISGGVNLLEDESLTLKRENSVFAYVSPFTIFFGNEYGNSLYLTDYLPAGLYYMETNTEWFLMPKNSSYSDIKNGLLDPLTSFLAVAETIYNEDFGPYWKDGSQYFYSSGNSCVFARQTSAKLYLVNAMDIPSEDILELPDNWSPLRMVAKNVNKENNLIFGTDWNYWADVPQANGQPMLDLSTILFRNQGRVYNHIYIYFKNLNGLRYATNSENLGTGNSTDWCADRVEYAFVVDNSLKYNYLASSVGTSILQGENVFNLGLNWSNPSARVLEVLDKRYPNDSAFGNTLLGRFPRNGTNSLDPITGEAIKPFGYGVWDYDYLFEYSNISSIDFVLGGSSDVFGLLTGAFNGLLPIFNVQILPNITLGILLFLPLIGGIIVIIIRVIKK